MLFKLSCPHLFSAADADADADAAAADAAADAAAAAAYISRNHSIPKTSFGGIQKSKRKVFIVVLLQAKMVQKKLLI